MIKQMITTPLRQLRFPAIIPVMALLLFVLAKPGYTYISVPENGQLETILPEATDNFIRGRVLGTGGAIDGAIVLITGTESGTITDSNGEYTIAISGETTVTLTFAAKGYQITAIERDFVPFDPDDPNFMVVDVTLEKDPEMEMHVPGTDIRDTGGTIVPVKDDFVLYVIDGKIAEIFSPHMLKPSEIKSVSVLKSSEAISNYGLIYNLEVKGITSLILIETKKDD